jgi:hypothetical protein
MSTVKVIRSSLESFTNPSRGPQPKDIYEAQQWEMAGAHASIMNGLLSLYEVSLAFHSLVLSIYEFMQKADSVPAGEVQNFVEYGLQWYAAINHHHQLVFIVTFNPVEHLTECATCRWEENIYYPLYNPKFNTDAIVAEHETFHAGVENLREYLTSCLPAGAKWGYGSTVGPHEQVTFDATKLRSLIDAFVNELSTHVCSYHMLFSELQFLITHFLVDTRNFLP